MCSARHQLASPPPAVQCGVGSAAAARGEADRSGEDKMASSDFIDNAISSKVDESAVNDLASALESSISNPPGGPGQQGETEEQSRCGHTPETIQPLGCLHLGRNPFEQPVIESFWGVYLWGFILRGVFSLFVEFRPEM